MEVAGVDRSFVFLGTGVHDNFKVNETKGQILQPTLSKLRAHHRNRNSTWNNSRPRILWASTHAPGLLKTPRIPEQSAESVQRFNQEMYDFLRDFDVPVFDTYNMTDGCMSFDGAHYGVGVNKMKVRILFQYWTELYLKGLL